MLSKANPHLVLEGMRDMMLLTVVGHRETSAT